MYRLEHLNGVLSSIILTIVFVLSLFMISPVDAGKLPGSASCADLMLIFARGSGENQGGGFLDDPFDNKFLDVEKVAGAFFKKFQQRIEQDYPLVTYKAVSVHNFPNLYNNNGYRAVGAFSATTFLNAVQAEFSWFPIGDYGKSVADGKQEAAGYIKDQISLCPEQKIVLGGYSQGAQVMGETVLDLSIADREHVVALALFGDPKYVGSNITSDFSKLNWFDAGLSLFTKPKAAPWKRGTAGLSDRGLADARIPYVPEDMKYKTLSWCFNDDFVCSGGSGIFQTIISNLTNGNIIPSVDDFARGHTRYSALGAPQAASEIVQRLSPYLYDINKGRGGKDVSGTASQPSPTNPNDKPIDVMMMLNTSVGVDDVLGQMRINTSEVLPPMYNFYSDVLFGIGEYSEIGSLPNNRIPRVSITQALTANIATLNSKMYRPLSSGGLSGGGLDRPDPHQLGIERAVKSTAWRKDSEKHIVLITSRMPSLTYTYNICNSDVRVGFGITTPNKCITDPVQEVELSALHPERCKNIIDALTMSECRVEMTNPHHTYNVKRTIEDGINLARSKGIAIDVVVPNQITPFFDSTSGINYDTVRITAELKRIADLTGGIFLKYDVFNRANYTDMYWRILNHRPKTMGLAVIRSYNQLGAADNIKEFEPQTLTTNSPSLFSAENEKKHELYKWDFDGDGAWDEETESPNTDHVFEDDIGQTLAVVGAFDAGAETARALIPVSINIGAPNEQIIVPTLPDNLRAENSVVGVVVTWSAADTEDVLFLGDISTNLPIVSAPVKEGRVIVLGYAGSSILAWVENNTVASERVSISINDDSEDPKILNVSESAPNSQFLGAPDAVPVASEAGVEVASNLPETPTEITAVKGEESDGNTHEDYQPQKEDLFATVVAETSSDSSNFMIFALMGLVILLGGSMIKIGKYIKNH